jgi:hypothetical protein
LEATVNRKHAFSISLAVGVAAVAGALAATKTIHLGQNAAVQSKTPSALIAQRTKALDRTETALRKALKQKPPALPPLPSLPSTVAAAGPPASAPAPPAQEQRVVYVRPAPIIRHVPRAGGHEAEHEGEAESEGGSHEDGGEFDD